MYVTLPSIWWGTKNTKGNQGTKYSWHTRYTWDIQSSPCVWGLDSVAHWWHFWPVLCPRNKTESMTAQRAHWHLQLWPGETASSIEQVCLTGLKHIPFDWGPWLKSQLRGKLTRQSRSQDIRTIHNSGIRNRNLSTWLASYTNSVNLSHHFLPVLRCVFQADSIKHVIWASHVVCNLFCSVTSGMACLVVYLEAIIKSR